MRVMNEETIDLEAGEEVSNPVVAGNHVSNEMDAPAKPKNNRARTAAAAAAEAAPPLPITLQFSNLVYSVSLKLPKSWWNVRKLRENWRSRSVRKTILHGVSGTARPGEMLVMLGPSGSGKTTLLKLLGGRLKGKLKEGSILYNGEPYSTAVKRRTGFVTQDDVLFPHLTVKDTLVYAAMLRLPNTFTRQEKVQRAEAIIDELGLRRCQDTIIGNVTLRGVSGGERKRVSIGHEMLIDPSILFLDEPTSGLDSTTALRIIRTLQDLANSGKTIVTTIHQPSSKVFHMFDKLVLLSEGHPLYFGDACAAMEYFASVGFSPSFATNPADYLLDLANGVDSGVEELDEGGETPDTSWTKQAENSNVVRQKLIEAYTHNLVEATNSDSANSTSVTRATEKAMEVPEWSNSWTYQFKVLLERGVKERRHEALSGLRTWQVLTISFMCGCLWWKSSAAHVQDQVGLLFFFSTFWGFYPLIHAIFTFPPEREMLLKERASGMYRLSAFFWARILGDLPLELTLPTVFVGIVYKMGGLKSSFVSFLLTLLAVLYNVLVAQGLGMAIGAGLMDVKQGSALASVMMLTFLLAGGYYIQKTPVWIGWIKYVSPSYYSYKLQLASQFSANQTYNCATGKCLIAEYPAVQNVGLNHLGLATGAMAIMVVGYRLIAYIFLQRMKGLDK